MAVKFYTGEGNYDLVGLNFVNAPTLLLVIVFSDPYRAARFLLSGPYSGTGCYTVTVQEPAELPFRP